LHVTGQDLNYLWVLIHGLVDDKVLRREECCYIVERDQTILRASSVDVTRANLASDEVHELREFLSQL